MCSKHTELVTCEPTNLCMLDMVHIDGRNRSFKGVEAPTYTVHSLFALFLYFVSGYDMNIKHQFVL